VISLNYSKKVSQNLPSPSFHVLSHHYQLIVLHIVAVCHELEEVLLENSQNVRYNVVYIARSVGTTEQENEIGNFIIRVPEY
jgi:hypothetical protein